MLPGGAENRARERYTQRSQRVKKGSVAFNLRLTRLSPAQAFAATEAIPPPSAFTRRTRPGALENIDNGRIRSGSYRH